MLRFTLNLLKRPPTLITLEEEEEDDILTEKSFLTLTLFRPETVIF